MTTLPSDSIVISSSLPRNSAMNNKNTTDATKSITAMPNPMSLLAYVEEPANGNEMDTDVALLHWGAGMEVLQDRSRSLPMLAMVPNDNVSASCSSAYSPSPEKFTYLVPRQQW